MQCDCINNFNCLSKGFQRSPSQVKQINGGGGDWSKQIIPSHIYFGMTIILIKCTSQRTSYVQNEPH